MRCPVKYLLVEMDQDLYDGYRIEGGLKIYVNNTWEPGEFSMIEATVVGVPGRHGYGPEGNGFRIDMQPGDRVIMSYAVVFDYIEQPDQDTPRYKNLIQFEGRKYWKCALGHVFAYIRDGVTHMVNGWVMADPAYDEQPDYDSLRRIESAVSGGNFDNTEALTAALPILKERRKDQAVIRHIGRPLEGEPCLSVSAGDKVWADGRYIQTYKTETDEFLIFRQKAIIAQVS